MRVALACWLALGLCLALPALGQAQNSSAEDQYVEHIPDARGDRPTNDDSDSESQAAPPGSPGSRLPQRVVTALSRSGETGEAALNAAQRSAPPADVADAAGIAEAGEGAAPIAGIVEGLLGDEDGMGVFLIGLMIAALLAAITYAAQRRAASR